MIVRQFISWVRTAPAGERAEATRSLARAWLISDLTEDDRAAAEGALLMLLDDPSPLVRQAMAEVFARSTEAPGAIVQALSLDQPSVALPVLEHSPLLIDADLVDIDRDRQLRDAMRDRPPRQSAGLGMCGDRRSRHRVGGARADRKRLRRTGAVFVGPHRRAPRPSRRDPGIDAGAGRSARGDAGRAGRQTVGYAGAIRCRPQLAQRRSRGADRQRGARTLDGEHRGAFRAATT